ncbi:hypothetical protein BsWGS_21706 [Bradybaena similaris]
MNHDFRDVGQKRHVDLKQQGLVDIRQQEQQEIQDSCLPGHIIQVCGPPLSGKSTLVQQAIDGIKEENNILRHDFMCETASSLLDVLRLIAVSLNAQPTTISSINEEDILSILTSTLSPSAHHVLVFHKCHSLRHKTTEGNSSETFPGFLQRMAAHFSDKLKVSIILTSRKKFRMKGHNTDTIEIGMLDSYDIKCMLQHYSANIDVSPYVSICSNMLPLPGAVTLFGAKYLADIAHTLPPILLEEKILKDDTFWSEVFDSHVDSVEKWMPQSVLASMIHFSQFFGNSFYEAHLECTVAGNDKHKWQKLIGYLRRSYILWRLPGTPRLVVHPLVVYYLHKHRSQQQLALHRQCNDYSCNRYTNFMCRLLRCTEINMEKHGTKGCVYGCLALEWPNIRHMIEMAIQCNQNTYKLFLKAAISGRSIILRCFTEEAHDMYAALLECAYKYGSESEQGMLEALLGHSKACTAILSKGGTWQQAEDCLESAIKKLRRTGQNFALMWAIYRKGIILTRQAKYKEAQMCFKNAERVIVVETDERDLKETFGVSKLQIKEEKITRDIYTANALIFLGENELAKEKLMACYQEMQNEFSDHPELATAINSLGLVEQRGNQNMKEALKWYQESYRIRKPLAIFNKEIVTVSLNNIGMLLIGLGRLDEGKRYLTEALNIRRELGWVHANTSLTLTHIGIVDFKRGDFAAAYKNMLDSDEILQKILCNHDTRLRINNGLAHLSRLLEIEKLHGKNNTGVQAKRSAKEYFSESVEIASRISGNHSDDGYHHLLMAHEHAMLLALGNSKEDYGSHKEEILPYFEVHEKGKKVFVENERIPRHKDMYKYFSNTDYEALDKKIFISHLVKACEYCQIAGKFYTAEEMWCEDNHSQTDSEENMEVAVSLLKANENELTSSLANSTSEQEDSTSNNLNNADMKTADSDSSNTACVHQDQRPVSTTVDFSLTFPVPKSQEDLQDYKLLYLNTTSEIETQKSSLIPENLQNSTPDSTQINKSSNTEYTSPDNHNTLKDCTSSNHPSVLVKGSPMDNSNDNDRFTAKLSTCDYSNANMLKSSSGKEDCLENNNDIIEYDDDYYDDDDYDDDDDDYDDDNDDDDENVNDNDITSETTCDLNMPKQYPNQLSGRSNHGQIDIVDNTHGFPPKIDRIRNQQTSKWSELRSSGMSNDMKDTLNQNVETVMPPTAQGQHSPAYGGLPLDNKQYQATDNARQQTMPDNKQYQETDNTRLACEVNPS